MLQLFDVSLIYTTGGVITKAVDNVNLQISPGEFVGIVGPSGSGKSSLLYLMAGLKDPTHGWIFFHQQKIGDLSRDQRSALRQHYFGFIFQQHFLIQYLTAVENVMVAISRPTKADHARALELLEQLGLDDHVKKFPHQLSGGQRQRVAAARALIHRPAVIFADEPTASLDHKTAFDLMTLIQQCRGDGQTALVVVTHDPSVLEDADRIVRMWDGRIQHDPANGNTEFNGSAPLNGDDHQIGARRIGIASEHNDA